jgi:hypothetical protein
VSQSNLCARGDLFGLEKLSREREKLGRFLRLVYWRRIRASGFIFDLKIDPNDCAEPRQQVRKNFSAEAGVAAARDSNCSVRIDGKGRIREAPFVRTDVVLGTRLGCRGINASLGQNRNAAFRVSTQWDSPWRR